jgi:hypothetical protein
MYYIAHLLHTCIFWHQAKRLENLVVARFNWLPTQARPKGPFIYYVSMFWGLFEPPKYLPPLVYFQYISKVKIAIFWTTYPSSCAYVMYEWSPTAIKSFSTQLLNSYYCIIHNKNSIKLLKAAHLTLQLFPLLYTLGTHTHILDCLQSKSLSSFIKS